MWCRAAVLPKQDLSPLCSMLEDKQGAGRTAGTTRFPERTSVQAPRYSMVKLRLFVLSISASHSYSSSSSTRACRYCNYREIISPQLKPS